MPPVSPALDDQLTRWTTRGSDLRKELAFQKDLLEPLALAAHGNRLALRERRRRDLRDLEQIFQESQSRWDERLNRIMGWKRATHDLQSEEARLQSLINASVWLQKARAHQDTFLRHYERRAERLGEQQQALHHALEAWQAALEERAASLDGLAQKQEKSEQPLYVSRARKQPEIDFVREQEVIDEALTQGVQQMRRSLRTALDRLSKAFSAVDRRASGAEIFYEVHKQEILSGLKSSQQTLEKHRESILSDALIYQACRHRLRRLRAIVSGLRCVEDIPRPRRRWTPW